MTQNAAWSILIGMPTVWIRRTLPTEKYKLSIKNWTVLFKEFLVKKDFVLGLFDQKAFF